MLSAMPRENPLGERLYALRKTRGWSQMTLSERSGVAQTMVSKIEGGRAVRPSAETVTKLAAALDVSPAQLLDSTSPLPRTPPTPRAVDPLPLDLHTPDEEETPLELALFAVLDPKAHRPAVFDAAREAVRQTFRLVHPSADLEELARRILDAAKRLDVEGEKMTPAAIMTRVATGSLPHTVEQAEAAAAAANAEADEKLRAKGMEPGAGRASFQAALKARAAKK